MSLFVVKMADSLERYSLPVRVEEKKLCTVFTFNPRDSKKGRLFMPVFDERFPLAFQVRYAYVSHFLVRGNESGNHYHHVKEEVLIPLQGAFDIYLEDVATRETDVLSLTGDDHQGVYVPTGIAHKVVSKGDTGLVLVLASHPSTIEDEIEYKVAG